MCEKKRIRVRDSQFELLRKGAVLGDLDCQRSMSEGVTKIGQILFRKRGFTLQHSSGSFDDASHFVHEFGPFFVHNNSFRWVSLYAVKYARKRESGLGILFVNYSDFWMITGFIDAR